MSIAGPLTQHTDPTAFYYHQTQIFGKTRTRSLRCLVHVHERKRRCFIVRDANGEALSYVYYENEPGRRIAPGLLTRDEARRIGINFAKLPELLKHPF